MRETPETGACNPDCPSWGVEDPCVHPTHTRPETPETAVEVLDAASAAAWDSRSRAQAITAVQRILRTSPPGEAAAGFAAWRHVLGYDGPTQGLGAFLVGRYRNPGDIALSLTRAALIAEAGDLP